MLGSGVLLVAVSMLYSVAAQHGGGDMPHAQPMNPLQGMAASMGMLGMGMGQPMPPQNPPVSTDPCVGRCTDIPQQLDPMHATTTLLKTYCGSLQCLKGQRSYDGHKSCLDAILAPQLRGVCDLDDSAQQQCYAQINKCQGIARETMMSLTPGPGGPMGGGAPGGYPGGPMGGGAPGGYPGGPSGPPGGIPNVGSILNMQTSVTKGLCGEYTCLQEAGDKCEMPVADLAYTTQGLVYMLRQQGNFTVPESLYCCMPDLFRTSLGKCYPAAIEHMVENKKVLEPILGASAVNALTDSARDFKRVMQEWAKQISSDGGAQHEQWLNELKRVVERFQTTIAHENLSKEEIMRKLGDPDNLKPLLRMACDASVDAVTCVLQETRGNEKCDGLWPFMEESLDQTTELVAEAKKQLEQRQKGGGGQGQQQDATFAMLQMYLDECPMDRTAARIAEASGYTSSGPVCVAGAATLLSIMSALVVNTV